MPVDTALEGFRTWLVDTYRADATFERVEVLDEPGTPLGDLCARLHVANKSYYEVRVLPERSEAQAGFSTEHRMVNEALEQMVLDQGGDLDELLVDELAELGLEPLHMDHFWERPAFRFTVRLPLAGLDNLEDAAFRGRVRAVLTACHTLFQSCVDEA
jgi:hypothetical protein